MSKKKNKRKRNTKRNNNPSRATPLLSICMIVRNEEKYLPECLQNIRDIADEIILVDTGSTDRTVEIAQNYGAKIFHFPWIDDFSAARNVSLEHAAGKWIIWLDADDRIYPDQHGKIRKLTARPADRAYSFIIQNRGVDDAKAYQCRMFPNRPDIRFSRPVHEQVATALDDIGFDIEQTAVVLIHTGYASREIVIEKKKRNERLMADWLQRHPYDFLIRYQYCLALHTLNKHEKAIAALNPLFVHYNPANKTDQIYFYSLILLGRSYLNLQKYEEALAAFNEAQQLHANSSFLLLSKAEVYASSGRYREAYDCLIKTSDTPDAEMSAFALDFNLLKAGRLSLFGKVCMELDRMEDAVSYIRQAIEMLPKRPEGFKYLAEWYLKSGEYDKAIDNYKIAAEKDTEKFYYYYRIGEAYYRRGRLAGAKEYFLRVASKSSFPELWKRLALVERGSGNYEKALAYLNRLQSEFGPSDEVAKQLVIICLDRNEYAAARDSNRKLPESEFKNWVNMLLDLYEERFEDFEKKLQKYLPEALKFDNPQFIHFLLRKSDETVNAENDELNEVVLKFATFFEQDNMKNILDRLTNVQIRNNRLFQAIQTLEQRIRLCRNETEAKPFLTRLGECYRNIGAEDAYQLFLEKTEEAVTA